MVKGKRLRTLLLYTLLFAVTAAGVFIWFMLENKSLIWYADGVQQHLPALIYYSDWLKSGANLWDFSLGLGADVLTTLNYYCIGDPLTIFCVFFNAENMHIFFTILIFVRLYLAGLAFLGICSRFKLDSTPSLAGALMYSLCCYAVILSTVHPFFVNALIYFPLMIWGMEKLIQRENAALFVMSIALVAVSNFTFLPVFTFFAVFYAVMRYFSLKNVLKETLPRAAVRCAGWYLLGLAISAVIFIPVLIAFMGNGRAIGAPEQSLISYGLQFDVKTVVALFSSQDAGKYTWLGMAAIALPASIMFFRRPFNRVFKIAYIIVFLLMFLPAFGFVMNGMEYATNRWVYVVAFAVSLVTAITLPELIEMKYTEKLLICAIACIYFMLCLMAHNLGYKRGVLAAILLIVITIAVLLPRGNKKGWKSAAIVAMVCVCLISNGYYNFNLSKSDRLESQGAFGAEYLRYQDSSAGLAAQIQDDSFYRVDVEGTVLRNEGMVLGFNGLGAFYSIMPACVTNYFSDLGIASQQNVFQVDGLDGRTALNALASVKYQTLKKGNAVPITYNSSLIKTAQRADTNQYIYKSNLAMPLGYTYSSSISKEEYDSLTIAQKQQAMLQSIVVENGGGGAPEYSDVTLPVNLIPDEGIRIDENGNICVTKKNSTLTITFQGLPNCETYLSLLGLKLTHDNPYDSEKQPKRYKKWTKQSATISNCYVQSGSVKTKLEIRPKNYRYYFGQEDYLINMGYSASPQTQITFTFEKIGVYTPDISVVCQPMDKIESQLSALRENSLENVNVAKDEITGSISLSESKYLCLTIPYSKGWSAEVDGQAAELINANGMYSALKLEAGQHEIKLIYCTPGLKAGAVVSILSILTGIALYAVGRRKKRRKAQK